MDFKALGEVEEGEQERRERKRSRRKRRRGEEEAELSLLDRGQKSKAMHEGS